MGTTDRTNIVITEEVFSIRNWDGYFITRSGRVFSRWIRRIIDNVTTFTPDGPLRELKPFDRKTKSLKSTPYRSVCLRVANCKHKNVYVHHLLAETFIGPRPDGAEVCHGSLGSSVHSADNVRYDSKENNLAEREPCRGTAWHETHRHCFSDLLGES